VPFPPSRNKKILVGSCHWVSSVPSPFTSETERRKEQNRNMEDMDFGCGEPCCGEPYLGFGRRMAFLDCWGAFVAALQKVGWLLKARQLPKTSNSCNATRIEH
jgi:hypothetical protein